MNSYTFASPQVSVSHFYLISCFFSYIIPHSSIKTDLVLPTFVLCFLYARAISAHNPSSSGHQYSRSTGIHLSSMNEYVSLDEKMMAEDLPAQSYEEVEAPNPLPIPPKPQPKRAQSKPKATAEKVDSTPEAI